ncbi:hypothetical protein [Candidatus Binatus sp.]|jgi:hypothetical protein|uniref:hypothetical protein n=1 Tax=Candidatus Binatus sp. TaxID=2811406 RepID=UPI003C52A15A
MKARIVDENVAIVANDFAKITSKQQPMAPQADDRCRLESVRILRRIKDKGIAVIDDSGEVMLRYRKYLSHSGQPGVGDAFFKHLVESSYNARRVRQVHLPKTANGEFKHFPADPELRSFDPDDRIYVALAKASAVKASIVNSVDSDYRQHAAALQRNSVVVEELCPHCLKS